VPSALSSYIPAIFFFQAVYNSYENRGSKVIQESLTDYQSTRRHIPEDLNDNLKSQINQGFLAQTAYPVGLVLVTRSVYCAVSNECICISVSQRSSPREVCGGKNGTGTGFSPSTSILPCRCHSTNSPQSSSSICSSYQKNKREKPGNLPKKQCYLGSRGALDKTLSLSIYLTEEIFTIENLFA